MKRHDAQSTSASPAVRSPWQRAATAHVEGQVTIQRASEIRSEDALLNMPVIPGDRLWTGVDGRAELQLADGMLSWTPRPSVSPVTQRTTSPYSGSGRDRSFSAAGSSIPRQKPCSSTHRQARPLSLKTA